MVIRPIALSAVLGVLPAALSPLPAQTTRLDRDVEFVRKLAQELRFISLAQREVDSLTQQHRDSQSFKKVFQLGIEISLIGARSHPNREERRTLFKEALERSKEFIERYPDDAVADRARLTMIEACYEFGRFLLDEIEIATLEDPGKVKELEAIAAGVYRDGVDACDKIMSDRMDYMTQTETAQYQELFRAWYYKGILLRENARAVKRDREPLAEMARDTLEEMIFEYGEGTVLGLRGFFEMAQIAEVLGDTDTATTDYEDTIDSIHTTLTSDELELTQAAQEALFHLMQEAYDRATETLFLAGRIDEVMELAKTFRTHLKEFGETDADEFEIAHPVYGHPVFLTEARAMAESGDAGLVGKALAQAQLINDKHPNDIIGIKAKSVLKDILEIRSALVDGGLLFEVAKGDYQSREYEPALMNFKRAYAAMSDAKQTELGLELWTTMAKCYGAQERYLEATLAACEALEQHGADGIPEPTADVLERAWQLFRRDSKRDDDSDLQPIQDRVTELLGRYGGAGSEAKLLWRDANQKFVDKDYITAAAAYARIPVDTALYEPAQSRLVAAWFLADDYHKAREAVQAYRRWLETPAAKIPDDRTDQRVNRERTRAAMEFYEASMDYQEATGTVGGRSDPTRFEPTITRLQSFVSDHRQHGSLYVPGAYDMIARLYALLGRIDKAEEYYRTLRNEAPNSDRVPRLATQIFDAHRDRLKNLETENAALIDKKAEAAEIQESKQRLAAARRAALNSGVDYMRNSAEPQYAVLWNSLQLARDLGDWGTAETVGRKILESHANGDAEQADKLEKFVKPILGEAYLRQQRFREAVDLLEAADRAADASDRPNYPVKRLLALALGGWFEFNERGNLIEVSGLDQPAKAYDVYWTDYKKYGLHPTQVAKYSLDWYRFYYECFSFARRAARRDSTYEDRAETLFNIAQSTDEFQTLKDLGPDGNRLYQLFQAVNR